MPTTNQGPQIGRHWSGRRDSVLHNGPKDALPTHYLASPTTTETRARECGCPPWATQCVHWEEQTLFLADVREHQQLHGHAVGVPRFAVGIGTLVDCTCGKGDNIRITHSDVGRYDTLDAARAEFRRREAELLGREQ